MRESNPYTGWGRKRSGKVAVESAQKKNEQFQLLEDGFLRSVEREDTELSSVFDDEGIYYDATAPCRLERLTPNSLDDDQKKRVAAICEGWRALCLSKYNAAPEYAEELPVRYLLLIDQVANDLSIKYGQADQSSFDRMLAIALDENPDSTVVVKMHPDIYTRKKAGHFDIEALKRNDRILIIAKNCHPVRLIEHADAVYTVTSQVGFEALIWGKRVRCFGMPFYAGWGLTEDELPAPERRGTASLEQLVYAALVEYPRYIDPERQERCKVETVMQHIGLQRKMRQRFPSTIYAYGFSRWKKPFLRGFLNGSSVQFVKRPEDIPCGATVALWGNRMPEGLPKEVKILRVEDGFLRSSGLGGDLIRPMSWVIDDQGIYYDPATPSRLETLLQTTDFDTELLHRAQALREKIVSLGVSKYNLSGTAWQRPKNTTRVILVPGQVENDASIKHGAVSISTNIGLLKAVRSSRPDAYVVYKPHPDVVAGLRLQGTDEQNAAKFCDEIIPAGDTVQLLEQVDEVHTLTSLTGFEALMRGVSVTCYGQPFYAGWGLTTDIAPLERRDRKLKLDELVAGALILYPTYCSRVTHVFTSPERAVEELVEWRQSGASRMPVWRRVLRQVFRLWAASGLKRNA